MTSYQHLMICGLLEGHWQFFTKRGRNVLNLGERFSYTGSKATDSEPIPEEIQPIIEIRINDELFLEHLNAVSIESS